MAIVPRTGLVLLLYTPGRRVAGFWASLAGAVLCVLVYLVFVP